MSKKSKREAVNAESATAPEIHEAPENENGFHCPRCSFRLRVYKTKTLSGAVVRERICDRCREKVETEETVMA